MCAYKTYGPAGDRANFRAVVAGETTQVFGDMHRIDRQRRNIVRDTPRRPFRKIGPVLGIPLLGGHLN
jgi:hypothetical protein